LIFPDFSERDGAWAEPVWFLDATSRWCGPHMAYPAATARSSSSREKLVNEQQGKVIIRKIRIFCKIKNFP